MNRMYVFTSTGNGLQLARNMAAGLGESEIISIPVLMKQKRWSIEGDRVGFIFPCYYGTVPRLVRQFIAEAEEIRYSFGFALISAGRSTGMAMQTLEHSLAARNRKLHYGRNLLIASNYMNGWYYEMLMPGKTKQERRLAEADRLCTEASAQILAGTERIDRGSRLGALLPRLLSPRRYQKDTRPWDREFSVDSTCTGCGTCARACPVGNITMSGGRPQFHHDCQRCMGCIQFCPVQAFSIEGTPMRKPRYSHRDIGSTELFRFHQGEVTREEGLH